MYIPETIIYIKYIKYELHRKYKTYMFKVFMASAVVHISEIDWGQWLTNGA